MDIGTKIAIVALLVSLLGLPAAWLAVPGFQDWVKAQSRIKVGFAACAVVLLGLGLMLHIGINSHKQFPDTQEQSFTGRWCGPFDSEGNTEVLRITKQDGVNLSGTSKFEDRFGNDKGGHAMLQGTVLPDGAVTLVLIRDGNKVGVDTLRFVLTGKVAAVRGSIQVSIDSGRDTFYTRPCPS